jgi:hypothetical protein
MLDRIGSGAFERSILSKAYLKAVSIDENSFKDCTSLEVVKIDGYNIQIKDDTFAGCSKLREITFGNNTSLGKRAFQNCSSLTAIVLPDRLAGISNECFYGCDKLVSVDVPDEFALGGLSEISTSAFRNCSSLSYFNFNAFAGQMINSNAFTNCGFTTLDLPCLNIRAEAFRNNYNLESVTIASGASIGNRAFHGCNNLNKLTLRNPASIGANIVEVTSSIPAALSVYIYKDNPNSTFMNSAAFAGSNVKDIYVTWSEGEVAGAPWGSSANIHYNYVS